MRSEALCGLKWNCNEVFVSFQRIHSLALDKDVYSENLHFDERDEDGDELVAASWKEKVEEERMDVSSVVHWEKVDVCDLAWE